MSLVAVRRSLVVPQQARFSNLPGLVLWSEAKRIEGLAIGDAIGTWADLSGLGKDHTQTTAAAKPTLQVVNGRYVVRTEGTDDFLTRADDADFDFGTGDFTIIVVLSTSDTDAMVFQKGDTGGWAYYIGGATNQPQFGVGGANNISGTALNDGTATLMVGGRIGTGCEFWRNGISQGTFVAAGTVSSASASAIGANTAGGSNAAADYYAVGLLNVGPTLDVRNLIRAIVSRDYGIFVS